VAQREGLSPYLIRSNGDPGGADFQPDRMLNGYVLAHCASAANVVLFTALMWAAYPLPGGDPAMARLLGMAELANTTTGLVWCTSFTASPSTLFFSNYYVTVPRNGDAARSTAPALHHLTALIFPLSLPSYGVFHLAVNADWNALFGVVSAFRTRAGHGGAENLVNTSTGVDRIQRHMGPPSSRPADLGIT